MIGGIFKQFASAGLNELLKSPIVQPTRRTKSFYQTKEQLLSIAVKNIYNDIPKYYKRKLQLSSVPRNEYASKNLSPTSRLITDKDCSEQMKLPLSSQRPKYKNLTPIFLQKMARKSRKAQSTTSSQQQLSEGASMSQVQNSKPKSLVPTTTRRFYSSNNGCNTSSSSSSFMRRLDIRKNMLNCCAPLQQSFLLRAYSTQRATERRLNDIELRQSNHMPLPTADISDSSAKRCKTPLNFGELMPVSRKIKQQLCVPLNKNSLSNKNSKVRQHSLLEQQNLKKQSLQEQKNLRKLQKLKDDYCFHLKRLSNDVPSERGEFCTVQRKLQQQSKHIKNKPKKNEPQENFHFKSKEYQESQAKKLRKLQADLFLGDHKANTAPENKPEVPRPKEISKQLQMERMWFSCCQEHKIKPQIQDMNLELLKNLICNSSKFHQEKNSADRPINTNLEGTQCSSEFRTAHKKNERNQGINSIELFIN